MLKALELSGFKSFADKTRLEFPGGVTCVVGPNGSGKSNVVDAIKWVMGSQSPKSLRGSEMTDVIFNGSAGRRPQNAAEVTLEFDNREGLFELGQDVLRITRRVYRSGEGEYAINGAACRLRDIRELLAGTGTGNQAYSIIEQGRVDAVLQSSPKDRRALFEEAAGISRFRLKKQEAARRLARVEQNLLRLSDIVDEVEGRLRRVRQQAGKARRHREQTDRLKDLRTQLGQADWRVMSSRLAEAEGRLGLFEGQLQESRAKLETGEARRREFEQRWESSAEEFAELSRRAALVNERVASLEAVQGAETDRLAERLDALTHAKRRLVSLRTEAESRGGIATLSDLQRQYEQTQKKLAEASAAVQRATNDHAQQQEQLEAARERQRAGRRQLQELEKRRDGLSRAIDLLATRRDFNEKQANQQAAQLEQIGERLRVASEEIGRSEAEERELDERVGSAAEAIETAKSEMERLQAALSEQRQRRSQSRAELEAAKHRLASMEDDQMRLDRLKNDMQRLLRPAGDTASGAQVRGLVADLLNVDFDTAPMIEAALGESAHHLVVDDGEGLIEAVGRDAGALTTRARFQRLDCRVAGAAVDRIDLSGEPGVMGRAVQFVEAEPEYEALVSRLLGRTWLVDTLATATRLASTVGQGLSFATFSGELLAANGEIVVGPQQESEGLLRRRKQTEALKAGIEQGEQALGDLGAVIAEQEQRLRELGNESKRLTNRHTVATNELADRRQRSAALAERRRQLEEQHARIASEQATQAGAVGDSVQESEQARAEHAEVVQGIEEAGRLLAGGESEIAEAERGLTQQASAATEARVALARHEQHAEILSGQIAQMQRDATQQSQAEEDARSAAADASRRLEECRGRLLDAGAELSEVYLSRERLSHRRAELERSKRAETRERRRISDALSDLRKSCERLLAERQQVELESERWRMERAALADRMREDYGIDLSETPEASAEEPALSPADRATLEEEMAGLRVQVNSVGAINLESLEELDELEARFSELSGQYRDLSEAKSALERLTTRISTESRQLFLATVEEVRVHFRELFRRLFGGGEADLVLQEEDGSDPLDGGVEIAASPPGKELRSISLLSGGEKTLTCVALLLAVFRTKPSPFCVLDEVDAALDEANIGRFVSVLSEFLSSTQFIVVTHSKQTMTGAGTLYGVTMQESGVSKQVSVRLEDVGEDGQIAPTATLRRAA